jgi:hypothetical protein
LSYKLGNDVKEKNGRHFCNFDKQSFGETLMLQTGTSEKQRQNFLQEAYDCSSLTIVHKWEPEQVSNIGF